MSVQNLDFINETMSQAVLLQAETTNEVDNSTPFLGNICQTTTVRHLTQYGVREVVALKLYFTGFF